MLKDFTLLVIITICITIPLDIYSTHIVGGDITYDFVGFNSNQTKATLKVRLNLYRDRSPSSSNYSDRADFGVYRQEEDGSWSYFTEFSAYKSPTVIIPHIDNPCREEPTDVIGVESAFYEANVILDIGVRNYMIAYQKCCRNYTINNIISFEEGAAFDIIITPEALRLGNNSVEFNKYPPIFICANLPLAEDVSGKDIEGDSLSYSFCRPLKAGAINGSGSGPCASPTPNPAECLPPFALVDYIPPYTADKPMAGDPLVVIDPFTGWMTGTPEYLGQYVIGMCIREYRDGKLLNIVRRDFQFNALECGEELHAILTAENTIRDPAFPTTNPIYEIIKCDSDEADIISISTGGTVIYSHNWKINDPSGLLILEESGSTLDRVSLHLSEYGVYNGELILNNGLDCPDTAYFRIYKNRDLESDFAFDMDTCNLAAVGFEDLSTTNNNDIVEWYWDFNGEGTAESQNPFFLFPDKGLKEITLVAVDDKRCQDTLVSIINYDPFGNDFIPEDFYQEDICYGDSILFGDEWIIEAGTYRDRIIDSQTGCIIEDKVLFLSYSIETEIFYHTEQVCKGSSVDFKGNKYDTDGDYTLYTKQANGTCDSIIDYLSITYYPETEINFQSTQLNECYLSSLVFEDTSVTPNNQSPNRNWDFGNGMTSTDLINTVDYEERGTYQVTLRLEDHNNCTYSLTEEINYNPPYDSLIVNHYDSFICYGDSININGQYQTEAGTYTETLDFYDSECDSIKNFITLSTYAPPTKDSVYAKVCPDESYFYNYQSYNSEGNYNLTIRSSENCDSIYRTLILDTYEEPEIIFEDTYIKIPEFVPKDFPVSYIGNISTTLWSPADGLSCDTCSFPMLDYDFDTKYVVSVISEDGCTAQESVAIDFIEVPYYIPNVINKNADDHLNRFFIVQKPEYAFKTPFYNLTVYDRWGSPVFEKNNIHLNETEEAFDARNLGSGVYFYMITIDEPRETKTFSGSFTIME